MYAVIGANGYLGSYVIKEILENTSENIIATTRNLDRVTAQKRVFWEKCDIQDNASVDLLVHQLSKLEDLKIVYLAAYHHPDLVERNRKLAWDINVTSLSKFVNKAEQVYKMVYASTDSVYGESIDNYHFKEDDALKPLNFYGHNKCAAEAIVIHAGFSVVRFPFLIARSLVYKKHFYDEIVEANRDNKPVGMFVDSLRSSLSFDNASRLLIALMEKKEAIPGIINICGDRDLSKYDIGLLIAQKENLNPELIIPVSINNNAVVINKFETKRAVSTLMSNSLLKNIMNLKYIDIFDKPY